MKLDSIPSLIIGTHGFPFNDLLISHLMLLAEAGIRASLLMKPRLKERRENGDDEEEVEHDDGDGNIRDAIGTKIRVYLSTL